MMLGQADRGKEKTDVFYDRSNLGRFEIGWLAQMARTSGLSLLDWNILRGLRRASKRSTSVVNGLDWILRVCESDIPSWVLCQGNSGVRHV